MNRFDEVTGRSIGEWKLSPPEIVVAENGFVVRSYDIANDAMRYRIAPDVDGVRLALKEWADETCAAIHRGVETKIVAATKELS